MALWNSSIVLVGVVFVLANSGNSSSSGRRVKSRNGTSNYFRDKRDTVNITVNGKSELDTVIEKLSELKDFAVQSLTSSKNASSSGRTFFETAFSLFTSKGSIRAMEHLQTLKDTLFRQFRKQSNELSKGRDGYLDPGQGAIAFPSLEGALLSLAFLTFAVFVIDLIQQFLSRYRTGYSVPLLGRRKRSFATENPALGENGSSHLSLSTLTNDVLSAIENPIYI